MGGSGGGHDGGIVGSGGFITACSSMTSSPAAFFPWSVVIYRKALGGRVIVGNNSQGGESFLSLSSRFSQMVL
jgi:hypothetical protein